MNTWKKTTATLITFALFGTASFAQTPSAKIKTDKHEEIIIRKKANTNEKTTIVIEGEKITVNGQSLDSYKGDNVTIRKVKPGAYAVTSPRAMVYEPNSNFNMEGFGNYAPAKGNKALLGVTTEKAEGGVKITDVTDESGAEKAGLKEDDIITKIGDAKIETPADLTKVIGKYKPADKVDIAYSRNGKENKVSATLSENKLKSFAFNMNDNDFNFDMPDRPSFNGSMISWGRKPKIGLQIQDVEEGKGVKVNEVDDDSPASKSGFKEGDVITDFNGKEIEGVDDLKNEIKDLKEGDSFKVNFKRDGKPQTADIKIPKRLKTADL